MNRRVIPATMGTQHPDNAGAPFFDKTGNPFISAYREVDEAFENFKNLDVEEYMWDWEGKHADAAVVDRLFSQHYEFFKKNQLGRDKFITFRFPNIWEEPGYSLMQAMTTFLSSEDFSKDLEFDQRPLFEAILPMAERAEQILEMQTLFEKLANFKTHVFTSNRDNIPYIEMIPLFEGFESQLNAPEILKEYIDLHEKHFGYKPEYLRVFLAGSDSALSSGFMNAIIGNKLAIARLHEFAKQEKIDIYPIAGMGSAFFRGGLSPKRVDRYLKEFAGVKTVTVQSAFRYDYAEDDVKTAINKLKANLQDVKPLEIPDEDKKVLKEIAIKSSEFYHDTLDKIAVDMESVFQAFPKRRDRKQHVGLLGYSRGDVEGVSLPRAITFTGAFYSIGVPPEIIGFGRGLASLSADELTILKKYYPSMKEDFQELLCYLNKDVLEILRLENNYWNDIVEDVRLIEKILGIELEELDREQEQHAEIALQIAQNKEISAIAITALINRQAQLRHFLG